MKKLLALLLAVLLPVYASAETYGASIHVETDETIFPQLVKELLSSGPTLDQDELEICVQLIHQLLNGLTLNIKTQEEAVSISAALPTGQLLDLNLYESDDVAYLTSSMLAGYALTIEDTPSSVKAEGEDTLTSIDWNSVADSLVMRLSDWLYDIEPTSARGSFNGDAYEGGTHCYTVILSDSDIAGLVSLLATEELRAALQILMQSCGADSDELLAQFDALNARVADEDVHLYFLRVVSDDAGQLVGVSLTVLKDDVQVATVSFGVTDKSVKLVMGLGLNTQNYWWELSAVRTKKDSTTHWNGTSREWLADKTESFAYVSEHNEAVSACSWLCTVTTAGERVLWDGAFFRGESQAADQRVCAFSGNAIPASAEMKCSLEFGTAANSIIALTLHMGQTEAIADMDSALQSCSLSAEEDAALREKLLELLGAGFTARLVKLLPLDLILKMNQLLMQ